MLKKQCLAVIGSILLLSLTYAARDDVPDPDPKRYQSEMDTFIQWDRKNSTPENAVLFVGSSSIRMWQTHEAFPDLPVINRGFGGAHISDMLYFYKHIILPYKPRIVVFYCGDNDIAGGKPVEQVYQDYVAIIERILKDNPQVKIIYLPIKPCRSRWGVWEQMKQVNQRVQVYNQQHDQLYYVDTASPLLNAEGRPDETLFLEDALHLNEKGYAKWNHLLVELLNTIQ